ncbi:LysR family transcriptional regulator [Amedibacillus sp. YH-ame10]
MKKEQLQHFVDIVQFGSINKASEQLYMTQPTLSRSIKALEEEMGKELLIRTSRGVSLTPAGKTFYNYAQSILGQFNVLERLKNVDEDVVYSLLSVSVDSIFLKDDLILRFYRKMRSTETEIRLLETTAEAVMNNVVDGTSEIGITILNDYQLKIFRRMAELKDLELNIHGESPLYVHAYKKSSLAADKDVDAKDLPEHIYIHLPYDFISNLNRTLEVDDVRIANLTKSITMSNYHAIIKMLHNTDSFILGHKWQINELKSSNIHSMVLKNSDIVKYFVIIKRKRELLSPPAEVFLDLIYKDYFNI